MSWVFLAGDRVYKLKKPVSYPFLDFTTLEARQVNCFEETRLNTRLAKGVYLGTVPLYASDAGELSLEPIGKVVDWLVCMKRLPAERTLDALIAASAVDSRDVSRAVEKLIHFYESSPALEVLPDGALARFAAEHAEDARVLSDRRFALELDRTQKTLNMMQRAFERIPPLLRQRAAAKVYVEGHGDLRPEHVFLADEPVFIDCLEFNRDLRVLDPFDEIAYLGLECERLEAAWIGEQFLTAARGRLLPPAPEALINFYRAARALLRARLALAHLMEPDPRTPEKWEPRARHYVVIAEESLRRLDTQMSA